MSLKVPSGQDRSHFPDTSNNYLRKIIYDEKKNIAPTWTINTKHGPQRLASKTGWFVLSDIQNNNNTTL